MGEDVDPPRAPCTIACLPSCALRKTRSGNPCYVASENSLKTRSRRSACTVKSSTSRSKSVRRPTAVSLTYPRSSWKKSASYWQFTLLSSPRQSLASVGSSKSTDSSLGKTMITFNSSSSESSLRTTSSSDWSSSATHWSSTCGLSSEQKVLKFSTHF